jgi:hypothetical protein
MLELFFGTIFIIQIICILKSNKTKFHFQLSSILFNLILFVFFKIKIVLLLRDSFNIPKTIGYLFLLTIVLFYLSMILRNLNKFEIWLFFLTLFSWFISIVIEYIGALKLAYIPQQELIEDIFFYAGIFIWLILNIKICLNITNYRNTF